LQLATCLKNNEEREREREIEELRIEKEGEREFSLAAAFLIAIRGIAPCVSE
jgi:hypothetical protein